MSRIFISLPSDLIEAKPPCSTLYRVLSRVAHVDMNTVDPTLSDPDVHDLSRTRTEKQARTSAGSNMVAEETSRDPERPLSGAHYQAPDLQTLRRGKQSTNAFQHASSLKYMYVLVGHQSGDTVPLNPSARCNGPRERGGTQHPFRNGARQILQAMTRTLTARACPRIPQCSKTPHAAGRHGEEGHTQPTGSGPRHHITSSVRDSYLHPWSLMTRLRACEPCRHGWILSSYNPQRKRVVLVLHMFAIMVRDYGSQPQR